MKKINILNPIPMYIRKMYRMALYFLVMLITVACINYKNKTVIKSIDITYIKGNIETNRTVNCGELYMFTYKTKDTLLINKMHIIEIEHKFLNLKKNQNDTSFFSCDIRMQCKINYVKGDSSNLCIGEFNCIIRDDKIMGKNDSLVYLIRKYSGYYNYFSKEDLAYFGELKQFGIPNDYTDLRRVNSLDSIPLSPQ